MKARRRPRGGLTPALGLALAAAVVTPASAYTIQFCNDYADQVVRQATGTELTYAMQGTPDPGFGAITGTGTSGDPSSLSSVLQSLNEPVEQKGLWQQAFNHCMGVTR
jgi:cysteine synthase